jgi:hypothetical protein
MFVRLFFVMAAIMLAVHVLGVTVIEGSSRARVRSATWNGCAAPPRKPRLPATIACTTAGRVRIAQPSARAATTAQ